MPRKSRNAGASLLGEVRAALIANADEKRAPAMQAYMKSEMPYHGVSAVPMRAICKRLFSPLVFPDFDAWEASVRALWDGARFREERYAAISLAGLRAAREFQTPHAMPLYEKMITEGAWWDYVDAIATHHVADILRTHRAPMTTLMKKWSRSDSMWKARTSIICQVLAKKETDLELLYACIEPSLSGGASKEFFIRKAIGWALRAYAWIDPSEVKRYVKKNESRLSGLSKREALKNT
jgi:3-methyladenine DNA glycosylase AlkD